MKYLILILLFWLTVINLNGQEELLSLLGDQEQTEFTQYAFKTNRIINLHSIENTHRGVLDFKISHRFGFLNSGIDNFFGLDQSSIRLGLEYGLTDRLMVGLGRSSFRKTIDGFFKYKIARQQTGQHTFPVSISVFHSTVIETIDFEEQDRENYFSSRLFYTWQVLIARKFSDRFSFQLSPGIVHRNLVQTIDEKNDILSLGLGSRFKISNRVSINAEYILADHSGLREELHNSISIGFDIETGGHVFQLHLTNSTAMIEKGFIAENTGNFWDGDIHFGFNISRVFTLSKPKEFKAD
jgi:hypothetical protein